MGRAVEADQREQHQQGLQQQPQPRRELHREDAAHQRGVEGLQIRHLWSVVVVVEGAGGGGGGRSDKVFSWNTSKYRNCNKEKIETKCQFMFVVVMVVVGTSGSVYSEGKLMTA